MRLELQRAVAIISVFNLCTSGATWSSEIKVMASAAVKPAYVELSAQFERATGNKIETLTGIAPPQMITRLKRGEVVDVVIQYAEAIDELRKLGILGNRVDLATSGIGMAVRAGAQKPDISSSAKLRLAVLAANSIAFSAGPSGVYITDLFQQMGIADELKPKLKRAKAEPVGEMVARGDAEIGFQQVSELLSVKGTTFVGPL